MAGAEQPGHAFPRASAQAAHDHLQAQPFHHLPSYNLQVPQLAAQSGGMPVSIGQVTQFSHEEHIKQALLTPVLHQCELIRLNHQGRVWCAVDSKEGRREYPIANVGQAVIKTLQMIQDRAPGFLTEAYRTYRACDSHKCFLVDIPMARIKKTSTKSRTISSSSSSEALSPGSSVSSPPAAVHPTEPRRASSTDRRMPLGTNYLSRDARHGDRPDIGRFLAAMFQFSHGNDLNYIISVFDSSVRYTVQHRSQAIKSGFCCINPHCYRFSAQTTIPLPRQPRFQVAAFPPPDQHSFLQAGAAAAASASVGLTDQTRDANQAVRSAVPPRSPSQNTADSSDFGDMTSPPLSPAFDYFAQDFYPTPDGGVELHPTSAPYMAQAVPLDSLEACAASAMAALDGLSTSEFALPVLSLADVQSILGFLPGSIIIRLNDAPLPTITPLQQQLLRMTCFTGDFQHFLYKMGYQLALPRDPADPMELAHVVRHGDMELDCDNAAHKDALVRCLHTFLAVQPVYKATLDKPDDDEAEQQQLAVGQAAMVEQEGADVTAGAAAATASAASARDAAGAASTPAAGPAKASASAEEARSDVAAEMVFNKLKEAGLWELAMRVRKNVVAEWLALISPTAKPFSNHGLLWGPRFVRQSKFRALKRFVAQQVAKIEEMLVNADTKTDNPLLSDEGQRILAERKLWAELFDLLEDVAWTAACHYLASKAKSYQGKPRSEEDRNRSKRWLGEWKNLENRIINLRNDVYNGHVSPERLQEKIDELFAAKLSLSNRSDPTILYLEACKYMREQGWYFKEQKFCTHMYVRHAEHGFKPPAEVAELQLDGLGDLDTLIMVTELLKQAMEKMKHTAEDRSSYFVFDDILNEYERLRTLGRTLRGMVGSWTAGIFEGKWRCITREVYDTYMLELVIGLMEAQNRLFMPHIPRDEDVAVGAGEEKDKVSGAEISSVSSMAARGDRCYQQAVDEAIFEHHYEYAKRQQFFAVWQTLDLPPERAELLYKTEDELLKLREDINTHISMLDLALPRVHHVQVRVGLIKARDALTTLSSASLTLRDEAVTGKVDADGCRVQLHKLRGFAEGITSKLMLPKTLDEQVRVGIQARLPYTQMNLKAVLHRPDIGPKELNLSEPAMLERHQEECKMFVARNKEIMRKCTAAQ